MDLHIPYARPTRTLKIGSKVYDLLHQPLVMGILNLTPDSFFEGSRASVNDVTERVGQMLQDGADIIDIGGYSTRPGASDVPLQDELDRTIPIITELKQRWPVLVISIDTFRPQVAEAAIAAGASIINDVRGSQPLDGMIELVASAGVPYIMMHSRGTPATMTTMTGYTDLVFDVIKGVMPTIEVLHQKGHYDIIFDPGFGFAKTIEQNFELLRRFQEFLMLDMPILAGISRKRMIWQTLGSEASQALNGTTALNMALLERGAGILRVHDVRAAKETVKLWQAINN